MSASPPISEFRNEVLELLRERYPDRPFKPGTEADLIMLGSVRISVGNLFPNVWSLPKRERRDVVLEWFDKMLAAVGKEADAEVRQWDYAKPRLRPKLVPSDYVAQAPDLVSRDFSRRVRLAYGIDLGDSDRYVMRELIGGWGVPDQSVHDQAVANLEEMSTNVSLNVRPPRTGTGLYLTITKGDAYDAARLALPSIRARIVAGLGPDARVGIPNRDFLVAWSRDFSNADAFAAQVEKDSESRPYPLTSEIFVIAADGLRPL